MSRNTYVSVDEVEFNFVRKNALRKDIHAELRRMCNLATDTARVLSAVHGRHRPLLDQITNKVNVLQVWCQHPRTELVHPEGIALRVLLKLLELETLLTTALITIRRNENNGFMRV